DPGPQLGHRQRLGHIIPHAAGPPLRHQLEPEGGVGRPLLRGLLDREPQALLIRPPAVEPPDVPVDPGHLADEPQIRPLGGDVVIELVPQLPHGLIKVRQINLLVSFKPSPLVVEADA
ncbi:SMI1/KNR4 family protein, partial [Dysosmobacter welbionis]